jgi:hypothetical protein
MKGHSKNPYCIYFAFATIKKMENLMRNTIDELTLSTTQRIVTMHDEFAENPMIHWEGLSLFLLRPNRCHYSLPETENSLFARLSAIEEYVLANGDERFAKAFRRAGRAYLPCTLTSQRDLVGEVILYSEDPEVTRETLADYAKELQAYLDGDCVIIELQNYVTYANVEDSSILFSQWEPQDSVGGFYLDSNPDLRALARDHFGVESIAEMAA